VERKFIPKGKRITVAGDWAKRRISLPDEPGRMPEA
jgi:hypothetical protein